MPSPSTLRKRAVRRVAPAPCRGLFYDTAGEAVTGKVRKPHARGARHATSKRARRTVASAPLRHLAVVRANGIGDFVLAQPALAALRAGYPDAELVLLGKPWHARFLAGRPSPVDRVEVIPPLRGVSAQEDYEASETEHWAIDAFCSRMRDERFDLAVQMHGGGRYSNPFTLRLGARITAGFRAPEAAPLDVCVPYRYYQHEVMRFLELARAVGGTPTTLEPRIAVTGDDRTQADALLKDLGYRSGAPLALLHPGASDPRRRWPVGGFTAAAKALLEDGAFVVVIGDVSDAPLANEIAQASGGALSAAGRLSLGGLVGLLAHARVAVCNDSGPHHLAVALGTPTVGIFWAGNLITAGPLTRLRHRGLLSWRLHCPVCGVDCTARRCRHQASFVAEVSAEEVIAEARDLMR